MNTTHLGRCRDDGFNIIEIIIVITVMGILGSISFIVLGTILPSSRDSKRDQDVSVIASKLEIYYKTNPVAGGFTYPGTSIGIAGLTAIVNSNDSVMAPDQSSVSLSLASSNSAQLPTKDQYIYQPLTRSGALCTNPAVSLCSRYILYYKREISGSVILRNSLKQQ